MSSHDFSRTQLELHALGELDAATEAALLDAIAADPSLAAHVDKVKAGIAAASALPPLQLSDVADLPALPSPANTPTSRGWASAAMVAVAALLVAIAVPSLFPDSAGTAVSTQYRGTFELSVMQERLGEAWSVGPLVTARPGDHLQFTVTTAEDAWLMVYDVEDSGAVSTFQAPRPVSAGRAAHVAVQLDDYDGAERIFVLVASEPIEEEAVAEEVNHEHRVPLADLDTLPHLPAAQRSILVLRETP